MHAVARATLPLEADEYLTEPFGNDPEWREATNIWFADSEGRFGFSRAMVERVAKAWESPMRKPLNLAFADGRALSGTGEGGRFDATVTARVTSSAVAEHRCIEPFKRRVFSYRGLAIDTTTADQVAGTVDESRTVEVSIELDTTTVVPAWEWWSLLTPEQRERHAGAAEMMGTVVRSGERVTEPSAGGRRFEQLLHGKGKLSVGSQEWTFTGSGLHTHRRGVRNTSNLAGHVWQTAVFASGRAFGYLVVPNADGSIAFNEAFVYDDGVMAPAQVQDPPWLRRLEVGQPVPVVLRTAQGEVRIEGETIASNFYPNPGDGSRTWTRSQLHYEMGTARYRWDDEETYNMIERSALPAQTTG